MLAANDTIYRQVWVGHELRLDALWTVVAASQTRLLAILLPRRRRTISENANIRHPHLPGDRRRASFPPEEASARVSAPILR